VPWWLPWHSWAFDSSFLHGRDDENRPFRTLLFSFLTFSLAQRRHLWQVPTGSHFRKLAFHLRPRERRTFLQARSKGYRQDTTRGLICGQPPRRKARSRGSRKRERIDAARP
jgi:hypothetical protein